MIRLAIRLAVSGGRESAIRLVLTAVGVAVGTTLLLTAAAADPAIRAQQRHTAWTSTLPTRGPADGGDPLLWLLSHDGVAGRELTVLHVAATGPSSPVPLGLGHVPAPAEVFASPALADLLQELPAERLADRFPSAPVGTISDEFLAGPDHLVAVVGMEPAELRRLDAYEIDEIRTAAPTFGFSDFLRLSLAIAAVGVIVPVLVFVGTSTRIGAARREQRFAAMRLAGGTPRQVGIVAAVEGGGAAVVGAVLGLVGHLATRPIVADFEIDGHPSFVADVRVAPALMTLILLAVPALAVAASMSSLRRLQVTPLGVARRSTRPRPTARRALPFAIGAAGFVVSVAVLPRGADTAAFLPVIATFALMIAGIAAGGPWLTVLTARLLGRTGRRASGLLAGRRLEDDPVGGFRTVSGLVIAVFVASVFSGVAPAILADNEGQDRLVTPSTLVAHLPSGTTAAQATGVATTARRAGGDHAVLLRADPDPERPLEDPAVGRARTLLLTCADAAELAIEAPCPDGGTAWVDLGIDDTLPLYPAPYRPEEVAAMPAELLVVGTDGTPATTDRIRTAIVAEVPAATPRLGAEDDAESNRQVVQLNRLVNLGLGITLGIAGCSLAVAVAAGIIERKRPFALLRLAGMQLRELQRTALLEAAAPLLLIASATAVFGLATSAVIVEVAGGFAWKAPSTSYWGSLAGGLLVAVGIAAAALPLLGRVTAPEATRFE